ncbi:hypothetical protein [Paenibacillus humicus]|uniref:hypothetical protein n=1 Tax=Paenibacillus humicus TaxID=412861 RepID=UPI000FDC483E|nr:hypothetical protein [Paenibacillus humicus]
MKQAVTGIKASSVRRNKEGANTEMKQAVTGNEAGSVIEMKQTAQQEAEVREATEMEEAEGRNVQRVGE